jgi:hypothetical protein
MTCSGLMVTSRATGVGIGVGDEIPIVIDSQFDTLSTWFDPCGLEISQ